MGEQDEFWSDEMVLGLHKSVKDELAVLFGYDAMKCSDLLAAWLAQNPHWTPDVISHNGAFDTAQRIHYRLALGRDPDQSEFLEWRKQFHPVWEARLKPELTEMQKSILRSRGVDV